MEEKPQKAKQGINQNLLIAIIGAVATILAGLIPVLITMSRNEPAVTVGPTIIVVTNTALPDSTLAPTSLSPSETTAPSATPTQAQPSETPTAPVGIYDVYLAQDRAGNSKTNVFSPQQSVFIFFNLNDPSGSNAVQVIWYAVDVPGYPSNTFLSSDEGKIVRVPFSYEMLLAPRWKVGKYKVELYLNGSLAATQEFEVK